LRRTLGRAAAGHHGFDIFARATFARAMPRSMRATSPVSTEPGPISITRVTPSAASFLTDSVKRTGAVTCCSSSAGMRAALVLGAASTFVITGTRASPKRTRASSAASFSAAGRISAQWKGADTGSGTARFAPRSLASAIARSTPATSPAITVCCGEL
jgi:hypothetical protein